MKARDFLKQSFTTEAKTNYGFTNEKVIEQIVNTWMNDICSSQQRFKDINFFLPDAKKILDLASGCDTAVFYGLLNGYDVYGIDPEEWKHTVIAMKIKEYKYPPEYLSKFYKGVGEYLPFPDNSFDCVSTYQTLEHVQNPKQVISEMLRVTKALGGIHIQCPDYLGTFEGHYRIPWLPLFPKRIAKIYLQMIGRPTKGLDTIQYVTKTKNKKFIHCIEKKNPKLKLKIIDCEKTRLLGFLKKHSIPKFIGAYFLYKIIRYIVNLFREDIHVNLFILVLEK